MEAGAVGGDEAPQAVQGAPRAVGDGLTGQEASASRTATVGSRRLLRLACSAIALSVCCQTGLAEDHAESAPAIVVDLTVGSLREEVVQLRAETSAAADNTASTKQQSDRLEMEVAALKAQLLDLKQEVQWLAKENRDLKWSVGELARKIKKSGGFRSHGSDPDKGRYGDQNLHKGVEVTPVRTFAGLEFHAHLDTWGLAPVAPSTSSYAGEMRAKGPSVSVAANNGNVCSSRTITKCIPDCFAAVHGFRMLLTVDGADSMFVCNAVDTFGSWTMTGVGVDGGGYLGDSAEAFSAAVKAGVEGTYIATLPAGRIAGLREGTTFIDSGLVLYVIGSVSSIYARNEVGKSAQQHPTVWAKSGFDVGQRAFLSLTTLAVGDDYSAGRTPFIRVGCEARMRLHDVLFQLRRHDGAGGKQMAVSVAVHGTVLLTHDHSVAFRWPSSEQGYHGPASSIECNEESIVTGVCAVDASALILRLQGGTIVLSNGQLEVNEASSTELRAETEYYRRLSTTWTSWVFVDIPATLEWLWTESGQALKAYSPVVCGLSWACILIRAKLRPPLDELCR
eukprot:COSAG05_NODE_2753_length_2682_cov_2.191638_2_plen_564_part_00